MCSKTGKYVHNQKSRCRITFLNLGLQTDTTYNIWMWKSKKNTYLCSDNLLIYLVKRKRKHNKILKVIFSMIWLLYSFWAFLIVSKNLCVNIFRNQTLMAKVKKYVKKENCKSASGIYGKMLINIIELCHQI